MFPEYAAVLIRCVKMLANAGRQIVLASVSPDANDALSIMRPLAILEEHVDSILGNFGEILALEAWQARKRFMKVLAGRRNDT